MKKFNYLALSSLILLFACSSSGPQSALDQMAKAMNNNQPQQFLELIDMNSFASNYLKNLTNNDMALSSLNAIGNMLGLGSIDSLIDSVVDVKSNLANEFERGVASGELMARCSKSDSPDCPWVPRSLEEAHVIEVGANAAIAKITTPARITSWLALHKFGEVWRVVGQATLESVAREYALAVQEPKGEQKTAKAKQAFQL